MDSMCRVWSRDVAVCVVDHQDSFNTACKCDPWLPHVQLSKSEHVAAGVHQGNAHGEPEAISSIC